MAKTLYRVLPFWPHLWGHEQGWYVWLMPWASRCFLLFIDKGAIYTAAWAGPVLHWAWAWHRLVHLHLWAGPDMNHKFYVIITPNLSFICARQQITYSGMPAALSPIAKLSWVWLASILGWPSVNALPHTQPRIFASGNEPREWTTKAAPGGAQIQSKWILVT